MHPLQPLFLEYCRRNHIINFPKKANGEPDFRKKENRAVLKQLEGTSPTSTSNALSFRELQRACVEYRRRNKFKIKHKARCAKPHNGSLGFQAPESRPPCCGGSGVTKRALGSLFNPHGSEATEEGKELAASRVDFDVCRDVIKNAPSNLNTIHRTLSSLVPVLDLKAKKSQPGKSRYRLVTENKLGASTEFELYHRNPLGMGEYGAIYPGALIFRGKKPPSLSRRAIAIKKLKQRGDETEEKLEFFIHAKLFCHQRQNPAPEDLAMVRGARIPRVLFLAKQNDRTFIAMEQLSGTMYDFIDSVNVYDEKGRWERFVSILEQLCRALHRFQTALGFVHGDLHADNVMVGPTGRAYLIDFGMASIAAPTHISELDRLCTDERYNNMKHAKTNTSLDLLMLLTYVLDREIKAGRAVGLSVDNRVIRSFDFMEDGGQFGHTSHIARFCHSVVEPLLSPGDVARPDDKNAYALLKALKIKRIQPFLDAQLDAPTDYEDKKTPLTRKAYRHHALYENASSVHYKPTTPLHLLKLLRDYKIETQVINKAFRTQDGVDFVYTGVVNASGKPHGAGVAQYKNNKNNVYYEGAFANGQRSGKLPSPGFFYTRDVHHNRFSGEIEEGDWDNDKKNGPGIVTGKGKKTFGFWKNGQKNGVWFGFNTRRTRSRGPRNLAELIEYKNGEPVRGVKNISDNTATLVVSHGKEKEISRKEADPTLFSLQHKFEAQEKNKMNENKGWLKDGKTKWYLS